MEPKITQFFDSVTSFFNGAAGDQHPWSTPDSILACEREVVDAIKGGESDEVKSESIMRLCWSLVHSPKPPDVHRGIAMLEASLAKKNKFSEKREKLYLLAVGYYRSGEYSRSRHLVDQCLQIARDCKQTSYLKKAVEDQITKDGMIGIGISATTVGLLAGIIIVLVRNN